MNMFISNIDAQKMTSQCHLCTSKLSTPWNLKRHLDLCHNIDDSSPNNKRSKWSGMKQSGGGGSSMDEDDDDRSEEETDRESDDEENTTDNSVFDRIINVIDQDQSLLERQEEFRRRYVEALEWIHKLKHNEIHRKIMETVRNLESEESFDRSEALRAAVEKRKFLLDRLVPEYEEEDEEDEN